MEGESKKNQKASAWCFTLNGDEDKFVFALKNLYAMQKEGIITYCIAGHEIAPTTGQKHLQGYVVFKNARTFAVLKDFMPKAHLEVAKADPEKNIEYCSKDGEFVEYGERPKGKGKRTDIDTIKEWVKAGGADQRELWNMSSSYQAYKFGEKGILLHNEKRKWKTHIIWIWGPTGTGKSERVAMFFPDAWWLGEVRNGFMFSDYGGQDVVILDDLRPQDCTMAMLIKLFDSYPMSVRTIGGVVNFAPHVIVVTCPLAPDKFYKDQPDERLAQLIRRIEFSCQSTQFEGMDLWDHAFPRDSCDEEFSEKPKSGRPEVGGNTTPRPSLLTFEEAVQDVYDLNCYEEYHSETNDKEP